MILASRNGHIETVKLLLDAGAKVNVETSFGATALLCATEKGYTEIVKLLLEADAKTNTEIKIGDESYMALDIAETQGHADIVKLLKEYGANK